MSRKKQKTFPFKFVPEVTEQRAEKFIDSLYERWAETGVLGEALDDSGIMTWPPAPDSQRGVELTAAQRAYIDAQNSVTSEIERAIRLQMKSAFREAASRVLGLKAAPPAEPPLKVTMTLRGSQDEGRA